MSSSDQSSDITRLISKLNELCQALNEAFASKEQRTKALHVSKQLTAALQQPQEAAVEVAYWVVVWQCHFYKISFIECIASLCNDRPCCNRLEPLP